MERKEKPRLHARDHLKGGADPLEIVFPTSNYSNQILNDPVGGLVLYWKLDELGNTTTDAVDTSGNGHTGTYGNGALYGSGAGTHPTLGVSALADGTAAQFDGVRNMVSIASDVPSIQGFGEMSIQFWIESSQNSAHDSGASLDTTRAAIVSSDNSTTNGRFFRVELTLATGQLRFVMFDSGASQHNLDGSAIVNDGARHHIVCTFDGTTMKIYVDGALDASLSPSMGGFSLANKNHGFWVGGGYPNAGTGDVLQSHYKGVLDELALYTVALPLSSVQTHYLIGSTASNPPSGTAGGDLTGSYPNPSLAAFGPGAEGPIGDGTHVPVISIDAKGRVSALTSTPITGAAPTGSAGGDLTGTYPNPSLSAFGPGAVGPIGDSTHVAAVTTDAKGRVSALSSVAISFPAASGGLALTPSPGSNTTGDGVKADFTAGETLAFGDPVYVKSDGKVWKANAAGTTYPAVGIALGAAAANATVTVLFLGFARSDSWAWTVGGIVYLSTSSGLTQTQPSATDNAIQVIGVATAATRLYVNPQLVYITHT